MIRIRMNRTAFERLRTKTGALLLSEADRRGPVQTVLDREHVRQVRRAFTSRGASTGIPWPAWSASYARWRQRNRLGGRMMRLTDTLYGKATSTTHGDYIGRWVGGLRYQFGFADDVGYRHEHGEGPLPVRSIIAKTDTDYQGFTRAFVAFYRRRIRQVLRHA